MKTNLMTVEEIGYHRIEVTLQVGKKTVSAHVSTEDEWTLGKQVSGRALEEIESIVGTLEHDWVDTIAAFNKSAEELKKEIDADKEVLRKANEARVGDQLVVCVRGLLKSMDNKQLDDVKVISSNGNGFALTLGAEKLYVNHDEYSGRWQYGYSNDRTWKKRLDKIVPEAAYSLLNQVARFKAEMEAKTEIAYRDGAYANAGWKKVEWVAAGTYRKGNVTITTDKQGVRSITMMPDEGNRFHLEEANDIAAKQKLVVAAKA